MSRRTYTAGPNARQRCARCGRLIRQGQLVTVTVKGIPALVTYKHAGRTCPPVFNRRPL